jgi:hypothetical protein
MFGGHEIANSFTTALICEDGHAYGVCPYPQCSHDAAILNHQKKTIFLRTNESSKQYK